MTWLSVVFLGAMALGFIEYGRTGNRPPLHPWDRVGADPFVMVVNTTSDSEAMFAQAPRVDGAWRFLGIVGPGDSVLAKLPYANTEVWFRAAVIQRDAIRINILEPGVGRIEIRSLPR